MVLHEFPGPGLPWTRGWERAIQHLTDPTLAEQAARESLFPAAILQESVGETRTREEEERVVDVPPEIKARLLADYEKVKTSLAKVNVRYWMEFKKLEPLRKEMLKIFKK